MPNILRTVVLLSVVIGLVSCQGDKIWNPDEFSELIDEGETELLFISYIHTVQNDILWYTETFCVDVDRE